MKRRLSYAVAGAGAVFAVLAAAFAFAAWSPLGAPDVTDLSPKAAAKRLQRADAPLVLDVRTPEEFAEGHIPGAVNVPWEQVGMRAGELDLSRGVVVYCRRGPRARKGEALLIDAGFSGPLYHVDGGMTAWQEAKLPVAH